MPAVASFSYDNVAQTIDVMVTGATVGHTYRATSFDEDSGGVSHVAAGSSFTMTITSVHNSVNKHSGVFAWDDFDNTVIGGTIFNVEADEDEYFQDAIWSYDGSGSVSVTITSVAGRHYGLDAYTGNFSDYHSSGSVIGTGGSQTFTVSGLSEPVAFFAELYTYSGGPYDDWGVRVFTPGVAGEGVPGNPSSVDPVIALTPTDVETRSAVLEGTANPEGVSSTVAFEYGLTTSYGTTTASQSIGSGTDPVAVEQFVDGLRPGRTYHYRLVRTP